MASFDTIGDIIIFNEKVSKKKAQELLKKINHVKTIAYKSQAHKGKYRLKKIKILAGIKKKVTTHKENNVLMKLDVEKCYFSPRLSEERKRINKQVKKGEDILVMFSGIGVYPINLSKNTKAKSITGIEINPTAHKYALENIKLNKLNNIKLYKGDVKKILPKIKKKFDRIIMPLPKTSDSFLDLAVKKIKKNGIIHYYTFLREDEIKNIKIKKFKILRKVKCGAYSPGVFRVCIDIKVS